MNATQRYAAIVEYNGTTYSGWQRQPFLSTTIQEQVENALSQIAAHPIEVICAGRTDAGVHSIGQVIHFDTTANRSKYAWLTGGNRYLPPTIRLQTIVPVRANFHARYHALSRSYRYIILNSHQSSALWKERCYWYPKPLDEKRMTLAAQALCGEHDFSAFRAAECQSKTPWRFIEKIIATRFGEWIAVDVQGNAFLHHMVRNIVGSLLMVGNGHRPIHWIEEVLKSCDRTQAGPTAPAYGLYFYRVTYPEADAIPIHDITPFPL